MNIYSDIGKEKTDKMVLRGLKNIMYNYSFQPEVATYMFDATGSNELNYSEWERCVIWNHFDRAYNIPGNTVQNFYLKPSLDQTLTYT